MRTVTFSKFIEKYLNLDALILCDPWCCLFSEFWLWLGEFWFWLRFSFRFLRFLVFFLQIYKWRLLFG